MNETTPMTEPVPVHQLFETTLTVSDLQHSIGFYRDDIGLKLAFDASERNVAMVLSPTPRLTDRIVLQSMLTKCV
jgi:hypothetical protein